MLRHLSLKDFVIVPSLELDFEPGFAVLTGETGAGKSILIDALQLVLGGRGDAGVVREGAARADISAEFDTPEHLAPWLDEAGFEPQPTLLLRRVIDAQGRSRAWVNGSAATLTDKEKRNMLDNLEVKDNTVTLCLRLHQKKEDLDLNLLMKLKEELFQRNLLLQPRKVLKRLWTRELLPEKEQSLMHGNLLL
jgi:DNA repair ATPase RecN